MQQILDGYRTNHILPTVVHHRCIECFKRAIQSALRSDLISVQSIFYYPKYVYRSVSRLFVPSKNTNIYTGRILIEVVRIIDYQKDHVLSRPVVSPVR